MPGRARPSAFVDPSGERRTPTARRRASSPGAMCEHYAVHARTSAHRAKLSKMKPDANVGMGRPSFDRPYSRSSTSMPVRMTSPGPGSRPSSSMSFDGGASAPPGPPPHSLADTEYVLCALCHTVLPVPPVDLAFMHEHGKPNRVVSHSSDATVKDSRPRRRIKDDEDETSTVLTTTDPSAEVETRKSLVLAHHNAHDTEHARRLRFPRFKEAWERRMKKQATLALEGNPEPEEEEPEQEEPGLKPVLPGQVVASPSQLSLSSLSASPSVAVLGLDGEDVYETYGRALKAFDKRSEVGAPPPPPPPPPKRDDDNESLVDWESRLRTTESPPAPQYASQPQYTPRAPSTRSVSSASTTFTYDSMGRRYARDETGRAFPVDADGRIIMNGSSIPAQLPSNLLPSLSPISHSTGLDSEPDKLSLDEFKEPGPPPPIPGKSQFKEPGPPPPLSKPPAPRTFSPVPPKPASPVPKFSPAAKPLPFNHPPPPRPPSAPIPRRAVSVSSAGQSQPYVPSPSPPPRLAFDTYGRVLKLGMLGWERDTSGALGVARTNSETSEERPSVATSLPPSSVTTRSLPPPSVPASSAPASETSSQPASVQEEEEEEEEPEPPRSPTPEPESERAPSPIGTEIGVPRGVATVLAPQRYTLIPGRSEASTSSPPSTSSHTRSSSSMSMRSGAPQLPSLGSPPLSGPSQLGFGGVALNFGTGLEKGLALGLEPVPSHLAGPAQLGGSISRPTHGRSASSGARSASAQPSFRVPEPVRSFTVSQPVRTTITPARMDSQLAHQAQAPPQSQPVRGSTGTGPTRGSTMTGASQPVIGASQPARAAGAGQSAYSSTTTGASQPAYNSTVTGTSRSGANFTPPSLLQSTGPTTRTTRPVVARKSTGEWTRLEEKSDVGPGGWKNRTQTPEVLNEDPEPEHVTSESEGDKSHSEASQLIRELTKTVSKPSGTARVISRTSTLPARTRAVSSSPTPMPAPERNPSTARANESIYGTARPHSARSFDPHSFESRRAFSPSAAWNSLTPASPRSQSTQSEGVDEFGSFEAPVDQAVEVQPFDEKQFLADLGFGITIPARRPRTPSEASEGSPVRVKGQSPAHAAPSPVSTKSKSPASIKTKSPASGKGKSPASGKGKSPAHVRDRSPSPLEEASDEDESLPPSPVKRRASAPIRQTLAGSSTPRQSLPGSTPVPAMQTPPVRPASPVRSVPQAPPQVTRRVTIRDPESSSPTPKPSPPSPSTPAPRTPVDKPSIFARASPAVRGPIARARAPSPLQHQVQAAPPPPPPPASVVPAHIAASLNPKPVLKTRRRARPMGSSVAGSVVSGYGRSAGSVVSGYEREGSVVSGYDGGSVVSGYDDDRSVVSGADDRSVSERVESESEVGAARPPVTLPPSLQLRSLELMSPSSDAPSSVVTPLSPGIVQALQARGISVEPSDDGRDQDVEAVAQHLAGMNFGSPEPMGIEFMGRVDTDSGFTSPVAPPGAPSDAGSLFSRVVSPKPVPAVARLSTIRSETASTRTKTPPVSPPKTTHATPPKASHVTPPKASRVTPPKTNPFARSGLDNTPKSQRSVRPGSSAAPRPESPAPEKPLDKGKTRTHGPSSVFSRGPESSHSPEEKPKVEWKLELPHHNSDPLSFQSFMGGMGSPEQGYFGLDSAAMRAGENTNAEPDSEPLTPTSSVPLASQNATGASSRDQDEEEEYDEVDPEEAAGADEEEEIEEDGRLTSSSEEGARTETADDDGLDYLTESIGEPFGLQAQADALPHMEQSFNSTNAQHGNMLGSGPLYDSPRLVSPPPLPEGLDTQFVDYRTPEGQPPMTPNEMEVYQAYGGEVAMPEEVLALQPVMCDACRAPMAASKWYEHISRSGHRRNAAHYAQWKFEHLTARYPEVDRRELWAQATRLDPRAALPTEYAFCEVCQVFLIRGDTDHFEGKKHLRCLKAIALRDADELESVRGSVSEEEDEPPYRPPMLASQRGVDWTQPRARSTAGASSALGHRAFPSVDETTEPTTFGPKRLQVREPSPARSDSSISLGTHWHTSPKKKRTWRRKRPNTTADGEQAEPRKRRHRRRNQPQTTIQTGQDEHITTTQPDPVSPLIAPISRDPPPRPRSPSMSPFQPRVRATSSAPRMKINLESARLETIQAQESARGYDVYDLWPTPPGSGSAKPRIGNALNTPTTPFFEPRTQLYAFDNMGSSTGPGTREYGQRFREPSWTPGAHVSIPQKPFMPLNALTPLTPLTNDRPYPPFVGPLEAELDTVGPEVNRLARLGLQTALRELVERYEFPLDNVSKLYRLKGCLEETERVLKQLRRTEDDLRTMKSAAFGNE
ncbi:unnamed protein product [Rhizoctonia solani]|uniref:Uncharacterized protein n=1 Tax=Rhizoctonia solani TaxID=456999 RepID=A0A8H3CVD1_9AGAM|nr:unnamed protein product [Rhizoctonia solani]